MCIVLLRDCLNSNTSTTIVFKVIDFSTIISSKNKAILILVKFLIFFTPAYYILSLLVLSKQFSPLAAIFTLSSSAYELQMNSLVIFYTVLVVLTSRYHLMGQLS